MASSLFDSENFMPHGHCFLYQPNILWLHLISDFMIAAAYYTLPIALIYFARKRPDMPFRQMFVMFGLFIFLCGTTHLAGIWVVWHPDYGPEGLIKAATAVVSFATAVATWVIMPQLLKLPSPSQLQAINQQLQATKAEVEHMVEERTAELEKANSELSRASQDAERANQAKSDFLANMSHEIRTPMNAVIGLTHILTKTELTEKQKKYVSTLQLSAESLLELINDLLDISKIESEYVKLEQRDYSLATLLEEVVAILGVRAREKSLHLELLYDPEFSKLIRGDATRMRQILMNLVSNAIKFTEQGRVTLQARVTRKGAQKTIDIEVLDTGIGIPPEKHAQIFDKFSQADSSITRKYGGSGLGLAITKRLVELMGGVITVESAEPQGSCFKVSVPYEAAEVAAPRVEKDVKATDTPMKEKHVLIVEDYGPSTLVLSTVIEQMGYSFDTAKNGREAMELIERRNYDLILMDMQMPIMDGFTATRLIRKREKVKGLIATPIIGMTAHARVEDKERCYEAGITDFMPKPITGDALEKRIELYLS